MLNNLKTLDSFLNSSDYSGEHDVAQWMHSLLSVVDRSSRRRAWRHSLRDKCWTATEEPAVSCHKFIFAVSNHLLCRIEQILSVHMVNVVTLL